MKLTTAKLASHVLSIAQYQQWVLGAIIEVTRLRDRVDARSRLEAVDEEIRYLSEELMEDLDETSGESTEAAIDRINAPCAKALTDIWNHLFPDDPDGWEYPAQASRVIVDILNEYRASLDELRTAAQPYPVHAPGYPCQTGEYVPRDDQCEPNRGTRLWRELVTCEHCGELVDKALPWLKDEADQRERASKGSEDQDETTVCCSSCGKSMPVSKANHFDIEGQEIDLCRQCITDLLHIDSATRVPPWRD